MSLQTKHNSLIERNLARKITYYKQRQREYRAKWLDLDIQINAAEHKLQMIQQTNEEIKHGKTKRTCTGIRATANIEHK